MGTVCCKEDARSRLSDDGNRTTSMVTVAHPTTDANDEPITTLVERPMAALDMPTDLMTLDDMTAETLAEELGGEPGVVADDVPDTCTLTQKDAVVGDHECPVVGADRVDHFMSTNKLQKLLEASGEDLGRTFSLDKESIAATSKGTSGSFACAVSDPGATDCPLVFVSGGFENLTGYSSEFATGRSCRFLQPTSKVLNDATNLEERKIMREFCAEMQPVGTTVVNLLLNERFTGERFWNLLRMQYVNVDGEVYIFAVQTNLTAFMPKVLQKRTRSAAKNQSVVTALEPFLEALTKMRKELRSMVSAPIMELKGYFTAQMNILQLLPTIAKATASGPSSRLSTADTQRFIVGADVEALTAVKYPSFVIPAKATGRITSVDAFGNAVIRWNDDKIGVKGFLKRDIKLLSLGPAPSSLATPEQGA